MESLATNAVERLPQRRRRAMPEVASEQVEEAYPFAAASASKPSWLPAEENMRATGARRPARWVDSNACDALCQLILDDRRIGSTADAGAATRRRRALPPFLYAEAIAPFLRFDSLLPNMLYAFGGRNQEQGPLDTVEMFNTWHGCWVPCPPMPTRRAGSGAAVLDDGRMMVIGGYNERGIAQGLLSSCDVYDPFKGEWLQGGAAPLMRARWGHGCAALGGKVYVVGGCSLQPEAQAQEAFMVTLRCCEVYSPQENRWAPCAPLKIARSGSRVVAMGDRHLAAIGGCDDVFGRAETQPTVELFDSIEQQWSVLEPRLLNPRTTAAAVALDDCRLLVIGGAPSLSTAEVYKVNLPGRGESPIAESSDDRDRKIADLVDGRMGCQAAVLSLPAVGSEYPLANRRCAVIIGGERCDEDSADFSRIRQFATVPVFDPETYMWRSDDIVPPLPAARTAVAVCVGLGRAETLADVAMKFQECRPMHGLSWSAAVDDDDDDDQAVAGDA
eukprot:TRINITY_DN93645_c0_g1_i1.p1 TRINITY_DN93645_c0_g1~~TRINITY_DN93645_c0_g1_i1.p1  ORF type:complete len:502 (-),score=86.98 TRINITY_DN93645_c0_g1_i1:134-1639(-)